MRPSYSFGTGQGFSYGKFETDKTYPPNIQHRIYKSHFRDISRFEKVVGNDCRSQICLLRNQQGPTSIIQTSASHEIATIFRQKLSNRHGQHIILRNIASNRPLRTDDEHEAEFTADAVLTVSTRANGIPTRENPQASQCFTRVPRMDLVVPKPAARVREAAAIPKFVYERTEE